MTTFLHGSIIDLSHNDTNIFIYTRFLSRIHIETNLYKLFKGMLKMIIRLIISGVFLVTSTMANSAAIDSRISTVSHLITEQGLSDPEPIIIKDEKETFVNTGLFISTLNSAQSSNVTETAINFNSLIDISQCQTEFCSESIISTLLVDFTISQLENYKFDLHLNSDGDGFIGLNRFFLIQLTSSEGDELFKYSSQDPEFAGEFDVNFMTSLSGRLSPGSYTLDVTNSGSASVIESAIQDIESNLSFTPVPLPAAVWLFGSAILGLISYSRR